MPDEKQYPLDAPRLRERALSRWENEGGANAAGPPGSAYRNYGAADVPPLTNAELSQLHIRVIALEGVLTALLADASERQLDLVRDMAAYIIPRPGFTDHPLTLRASAQMTDLLERAARFQTTAAGD